MNENPQQPDAPPVAVAPTPETDAKAATHFDMSFHDGPFVEADFARSLERERDRLRKALKDIGEYKGEGGPNTPWQAIVRDIGVAARAALNPNKTTE